MKGTHTLKHRPNYIEVGRKFYMRGSQKRLMILYRCSVCGHEKYTTQPA